MPSPLSSRIVVFIYAARTIRCSTIPRFAAHAVWQPLTIASVAAVRSIKPMIEKALPAILDGVLRAASANFRRLRIIFKDAARSDHAKSAQNPQLGTESAAGSF